MAEDGRAVLLNMLYQAPIRRAAIVSLRVSMGSPRRSRLVELHQIERVEESAMIVAATAQQLEVGYAVVIDYNDLASIRHDRHLSEDTALTISG